METAQDKDAQTGITNLPSFSIIIETENLAVEDVSLLINALDALARQTVSPERADQVLLVNSGRVPTETAELINTRFPWIQWYSMDTDSTYYEAKQSPVHSTTGDIVVFCDCDCRYNKSWLASLLSVYQQKGDAAQVVTGETANEITSFHSYFVALAWCFPPHTYGSSPYPTEGYAANNVSFRRSLLESHPIPTELKLYRGNCSIHARELRAQGVTIWKSPGARAYHPTLRPSHMPARFFMWGHHEFHVCRARASNRSNSFYRFLATLAMFLVVCVRRLVMPFFRWPRLIKRYPTTLVYAPPMLLYIAFADLLFVLGGIATLLFPSMSMLGLAKTLEASEHG